MTRHEILVRIVTLKSLSPTLRRAVLAGLSDAQVRAIAEEWWWQAHGGQIAPRACENGDPWRVWAIVAGRGFGKTRAGAEWIWARAREARDIRIALVAATLDEVERVMVEGESGLIACARCDEVPRWISSRGLFLFPSGAQGHAFTAEKPGKLRGPQHHYAWCDELAKWPRAAATWSNLMLGLRLGERPRTMITTTPQTDAVLGGILAQPGTAITRGRTDENPHLPAGFLEAMHRLYGGTRLGRQELEGIILEDYERPLWTREMLEKARSPTILPSRPDQSTTLIRTVIGLDPPASTHGDACGIIVCGLDEDDIAWVLADLTAPALSPEQWARRVADAARLWGAQKIVAEKNQGGDMIAAVLRGVDTSLPVRLVSATKSKAARAEPVALRFETAHARLAGTFPDLEDQLCALTYDGWQGQGSPDRADAMVWAMTELIEKAKAEPRIHMF